MPDSSTTPSKTSGKKGYYWSSGEMNYRKIVQQRRDDKKRPPAERAFYAIYGKWPNALELSQAEPYLKIRHDKEEDDN